MILVLLTACTGSSSKNDYPKSEGLALSGSVGDGPIVGASILITDADDELVLETTSDAAASYSIDVPDGTQLPVWLRVSGGTDLVTGRGADFELLAVAFSSGPLTLNASPYTTLAIRTAQCLGEVTPETLSQSWSLIDQALNFGWDVSVISNPMSDAIDSLNVATVLLGNEALGEVVRRTEAALTSAGISTDANRILLDLGCDLADGNLDGFGPGVDPRSAITALAVATAVRLEVIAGALFVDGQDATSLLDDALRTVIPGADSSVADVAPNTELIAQAQSGLAVLGTHSNPVVPNLSLALADATPATARAQITPIMDATARNQLTALPELLALSDQSDIADLAARQAASHTASTPVVSLDSSNALVTEGQSVSLSWASSDAESCVAAGGWNGTQTLSGTFSTGPLMRSTEFSLSCLGLGGVARESVQVSVTPVTQPPVPDPAPDPDPPPPPPPAPPVPPPVPAPALTFSPDRAVVDAGDSALLTWSASNSDSCTAGGAWSGSRSVSGTLLVGPLTSNVSFSMTCSGSGGSVSQTVAITVNQPAPVPAVSLNASTASVESGSSTTLSWSASNSSSCSASGAWSGSRALSGSVSSGILTADSTFNLTCVGPGGSALDSVTVTVTQPPPADPPTLSFNAADTSIDSGDSTTLSWSTTNADSCAASGAWSGNVATAGSVSSGTLSADSTFALTCTGPGGNASDSISITVIVPPPADPPSTNLSVADSTINSGDTTTLNWSSTEAISCQASGSWSGSRATSGSQAVSPTANSTYTLTCTGDGGSDIDTASVTVITPAPSLSFSTSDTAVGAGGSVTLSWSSSDTSSCSASGGWSGSKGAGGSELVGPIDSQTTFTLSCSGAGGNIVEMLTVSTVSAVTLNWQAPTENVDGSTLTDLAGYRIYYGTGSRDYSDMVDVVEPSAVSETLDLVSGDYYVAMTALDQDGNESAYSNEVLKTAL